MFHFFLHPGDVYGLSGLILNAALLSPLTPNKLLLGYLEHALATQVKSLAQFFTTLLFHWCLRTNIGLSKYLRYTRK